MEEKEDRWGILLSLYADCAACGVQIGGNINPEIAELQKQNADLFEITSNKSWLRIKSKKPVYETHPVINGPAFLDYNIDLEDTVSLDYRSRNVWLRDANGRGFQSVSYCRGMGIWQVAQSGQPCVFSELNPESQALLSGWLKAMDDYVSRNVKGLMYILNQTGN